MYGLTDVELGFSNGDPALGTVDAFAELSARVLSAERVDSALVTLMKTQTHYFRLQDRRFGAAIMLDQMTAHVDMLKGLLAHSVAAGQREALARVLADAAALAGWQALDSGAAKRAWDHFTTARLAGLEGNQPALLAHAIGEQAYALLELGRPTKARELIAYASTLAPLPPMLRAWLLAAEGEFLAAEGAAEPARRAFEQAFKILPADPVDFELPFLTLDVTHLTRWRGSALSQLGDPAAIDDLRKVLVDLDPDFVRARCAVHADLARALAAAGQRDESRQHIRLAKELAREVGSQRLLNRLAAIELPSPRGQQLEQPDDRPSTGDQPRR
ncbi:hypothetical protein [Cryobacterium sp. MDB2-33-2]|uniref:hypothetical protein n=1 Tax=Cryobacterium sp. MDB2-33-2 TaxID=1259179 RepID=UPI00106CC0D4|nr:hypothetical protein [Cryobacterium sp. MDB2-33-2]TFC08476.1 hypothetical protein E3O59_08460 [Cryobacterium sp. MDB2-33-2]